MVKLAFAVVFANLFAIPVNAGQLNFGGTEAISTVVLELLKPATEVPKTCLVAPGGEHGQIVRSWFKCPEQNLAGHVDSVVVFIIDDKNVTEKTCTQQVTHLPQLHIVKRCYTPLKTAAGKGSVSYELTIDYFPTGTDL